MAEPSKKHARVDGSSGVVADTLSLEAVVCRLMGGFVGISGTVSLSIMTSTDASDDDSGDSRASVSGMMIRKVWNVGTSPPRIEIVKFERGFYGRPAQPAGVVVQTLGFTPTNSAWAARWIVDFMNQTSFHYEEEPEEPLVTLRVFDLPKTCITMVMSSTESKERLRSLARTWELVSEAAVVATS
jgi:hypothetical protein